MEVLPKLMVLDCALTVHRLAPALKIPSKVYDSRFVSITKTTDETSVVCETSIHVDSPQSEDGWSAIKVLGPLDFSLTGILAKISAVLAEAKISIFAISTFDTDYILVKTELLEDAISALGDAGYRVDASRI